MKVKQHKQRAKARTAYFTTLKLLKTPENIRRFNIAYSMGYKEGRLVEKSFLKKSLKKLSDAVAKEDIDLIKMVFGGFTK